MENILQPSAEVRVVPSNRKRKEVEVVPSNRKRRCTQEEKRRKGMTVELINRLDSERSAK